MFTIIIVRIEPHKEDGLIKVKRFHSSIAIKIKEIVTVNLDKTGVPPQQNS